MAGETDSELIEKIRAVVDRVYSEQLSDGVNAVESLRLVGNTESDVGIFQYESRQVTWAVNPFAGNIDILTVEKYEETEQLSDYLEQEYDLRIVQPVLNTLLVRVFGRELEHLDNYNQRLDDLAEDITADAENPKYDGKTFIFGLETKGREIELPTGKLREPVEEDVSFHVDHISELLPNQSGISADEKMLNSSIFEFATTESEDLKSQKEAHSISDFTCNILNLYYDASYSTVRRELHPRYFRPSGSTTTHPEPRLAPENRFEIETGDSEKLARLYRLMNKKWSRDDNGMGSFQYPFDVAVNYLYRAWEQKNGRRESMGWLVIAFEAIYGSGKGKVSTYCGVLLDSADQLYEPLKVRSNVQDAFDERHSWAHGGSIKKSGMSDSKARIRDYLRSTLIAYCYLITEGHAESYQEVVDLLEDAVVDKEVRNVLQNHFSDFNFQDYIRIDDSLHQ
jgi:hypothetical protein